jgi:hypothetical protein
MDFLQLCLHTFVRAVYVDFPLKHLKKLSLAIQEIQLVIFRTCKSKLKFPIKFVERAPKNMEAMFFVSCTK